MSAISAECLTLPQYVDKSYLESGSGRLPGRELDMVKSGTELKLYAQQQGLL
jgi:hypothetical protein